MLNQIRIWLLGMIGAAMFCAVAEALTPAGSVQRVQKMLCGIVLAAAMVTPFFSLDYDAYARQLAKIRQTAASADNDTKLRAENLSRTIIEEELEAYILDKAQTFGADISSAAVSARWSTEGVWYPVAVTLDGSYNEDLAELIESELGISADRQQWGDE